MYLDIAKLLELLEAGELSVNDPVWVNARTDRWDDLAEVTAWIDRDGSLTFSKGDSEVTLLPQSVRGFWNWLETANLRWMSGMRGRIRTWTEAAPVSPCSASLSSTGVLRVSCDGVTIRVRQTRLVCLCNWLGDQLVENG